MSILSGLPLEALTEAHLQSLVEDKVPEARDLEYKQAEYGGSDSDKREFLKDVTAIANTAGGHIIIGLAEEDGVAASLPGLGARPADEEIRRLDSLLQSSVEPRLFQVRMRSVPLASGAYALVVSVPKSWNPPHRVTHGNSNRYHLRNSAGTYEPSVDQLRAVFLGSAETERRIQEFRLDRLARAMTGERGLKLKGPGVLLVHTVPLANPASFDVPTQVDLGLHPLGGSGATYRHNLEGLLMYAPPDSEGRTSAYTQVFRDGRIEMAIADILHLDAQENGCLTLGASFLLEAIVRAAHRSLLGANRLGAAFPMAVVVSLLGARGARLGRRYDYGSDTLDRDEVLLEPVLFEAWAGNTSARGLLPVFDALWNAFGDSRCGLARDEHGEWAGVPPGWT